MVRSIILSLLVGAVFTACVPHRKFVDAENARKKTEQENTDLRSQKEKLEAKNTELNTTMTTQQKALDKLVNDTALYGRDLRELKVRYDKINELNDILQEKSSELMKQTAEENKKLLEELNRAQENLQKKEDMLRALETDLNKKQSDIDAANKSLEEKQKRLEEVEKLLADQQAKSDALQKKLEAALLGYKDKGLSVTQKDGKVYVSMEAKLLFDPGSTAVDAEGKTALTKLAQAIESETDMQITVEGHTDTDEFHANTSPKDNWELSVLRATEVIKILLESSSVNPALLNASGRSQFHPVGDDKAKNRRIEVILEPKLDELYEMIDQGK